MWNRIKIQALWRYWNFGIWIPGSVQVHVVWPSGSLVGTAALRWMWRDQSDFYLLIIIIIIIPVSLGETLYWDNSALTSLNLFYPSFEPCQAPKGLAGAARNSRLLSSSSSAFSPHTFECQSWCSSPHTKPAQGFLLLVTSQQEKTKFGLFPVIIWHFKTRQSFWAQTSSKNNFSLWNVSSQCKLQNPSWVGVASELSRFELLLFCNFQLTEQ